MQKSKAYSIGKVLGFVFSFALFTTILYWVINIAKGGLPLSYVLAITGGVTLIGYGIRRLL